MVFSRDERMGGDGKEACGPRNLKNEKQKTKKRRKFSIRTRRSRTWECYIHTLSPLQSSW
jgi:hypothetical protein